MKKSAYILLSIGVFLMLIALSSIYLNEIFLNDNHKIIFQDRQGSPLSGTYYPGESQAGVLIMEGFSADQVMMRSLVAEYRQSQYHVFTFDYSGQGYSPGSLGFDNAATDRLAFQVQAAMQEFMHLSNLVPTQITWLGHSLGARIALQSAVIGPVLPDSLILMGAQVNLGSNAQSEFFTGTSDADLDWPQTLSKQFPPIPILLISGTWDDILTIRGGTLLMNALCSGAVTTCENRQWILLNNLIHNFEVYSPRAISKAIKWSNMQSGLPASENPRTTLTQMRIIWWLVAMLGMGIVLSGTRSLVMKDYPHSGLKTGFEIVQPERYLWKKLLLWLPALILGVLIMGIYLVLPLGNPVFNLLYTGFIGGYGLLLVFLYRLGRVAGTSGKLKEWWTVPTKDLNRWFWAIAFNGLLYVFVILFYRTGQGLVPPVGEHLVWVFLLTPPTALGFWLGAMEDSVLAKSYPHRGKYRFWALMIGLFPFFVRFFLVAVLGSVSGMVSAGIGLILLGIVLVQGEITRHLLQNAWIAAILQSVLLYIALMPQSVLFTPFLGS